MKFVSGVEMGEASEVNRIRCSKDSSCSAGSLPRPCEIWRYIKKGLKDIDLSLETKNTRHFIV